jgi:hypothetical protein
VDKQAELLISIGNIGLSLNEKELKCSFYLNLAATPFGGIAGYQQNRQDSVVERSNNRLARGGKTDGVTGYSNLALSRNLTVFFDFNMGFKEPLNKSSWSGLR